MWGKMGKCVVNMLAGAFSSTSRMWLFAVAHLYIDVCENEKNEDW